MSLTSRRTVMARKRYKPEEIVAKLRQVDVLVSQGQNMVDAIRQIGVSEVTYYRWRQEFGGLKIEQVKRLAANSEPGRRRPTGRSLPPFGHGDQAFALGQLPGGLPRASDGFRLLARLAFRRFFIRPAALHLAKNALALQLLFKNPKSLIDIVVANEYLQNFSDLL